MFPDKPGGLSVYAREGWRKYFSLAGPIAVFGYWFAWSSVLAIYGVFVGLLLVDGVRRRGLLRDRRQFDAPVVTQPITWPVLIGVMCILLCYIFNVRGMRPAVWFSYVVGRADDPARRRHRDRRLHHRRLLEPSDQLEPPRARRPPVYGDPGNGFHQFALVMVWLYIIGWSTYGPEAAATFAPEYKDTTNDTRKALAVDRRHQRRAARYSCRSRCSGRSATTASSPTRTASRTSSDVLHDDRRRGLRHVPRRLSLRRPAAVDEHGDDGRLAGALRAVRGEDDDQAARGAQQAPRPGSRDDRGHAAQHLPRPLLREHLLHPRRGQRRATCSRTCSRSRACCSCARTGRTGRGRSGSRSRGWWRQASSASRTCCSSSSASSSWTTPATSGTPTSPTPWAKLPEMIGVAVGSLACRRARLRHRPAPARAAVPLA